MYPHLGDFPTGQTIYCPFHTFDSNDPSASVAIAALVLADVRVYKDGSVTQRTSTAGFTLLDTDGIDFDGIVGIGGVSVDTSDNTDAGFFAAGSDYWVIIGPVTIDAAVINFIAATFSIDNRGLLRPTVAERTLDVTAGGEAGLDLDNTSGTLAAAQIATGALTAAKFAAGAIDAAALATDAVNEIRDAILSDSTSFAGANVDATISSRATPAQVNTEVDNALDTAIPGGPTADSINQRILAIDDLTQAGGDGDLAALDTKIDDVQGATFSSATDSLEAVRNRGDAAWTTGAGGSDRLLLADTTIATLDTQTSFTLTAGSADDNAYNNCTIVVEDASTAAQKSIGMVLNYTGGTLTVTLREALAFTIATTDKVYILAENSLKSTVANRQLNVAAGGEAEADIIKWLATAVNAATAGVPDVNAERFNNLAGAAVNFARWMAAGVIGTADSGTTTTMVDAARTEADNVFNGSRIVFASGTISGQARLITDFDAASDTFTFAPALTAAVTTETYAIIPKCGVDLQSWLGLTTALVAPSPLISGRVDGSVGAMAANVLTATATAADHIGLIWDEDIVAAHGTADTAGLLLRALGALISQRTNNPTLDALLGVSDTASNDVPNQILRVETFAELAQAIPAVTPTFEALGMLLYMPMRDKLDVTSGFKEVHNDAGTVVAKKVVSDDGTTYSEAKMVAGP